MIKYFKFYTFKDGKVYFITDVGIKEYNYETDEFDNYKVKNMPAYFQITCMMESSNGDQWFGSYNGGLYRYMKDKKEFKDI